jgi:hypothetical protein
METDDTQEMSLAERLYADRRAANDKLRAFRKEQAEERRMEREAYREKQKDKPMRSKAFLRIGRTCFSCHYNTHFVSSEFINCRRFKRDVWNRAACPNWWLAIDPRKLRVYGDILPGRLWKTRENRYEERIFCGERHYYPRHRMPTDEYVPFLGRSCFTCVNAGERKRTKVFCEGRVELVSSKACCRNFRLQLKDRKKLNAWERYMKRSGADTEHSFTWRQYKAPKGEGRVYYSS